MPISYSATIAENAIRLVNIRASKLLAYGYVISLLLVYTIVAVHVPIAVSPGLPADDGLYMALGRSLAEGRWLGVFNEWTLAKGPGYPAFLALANWLGIPISLAQATFRCFAILVFVVVCHQFIRSQLMSAALLALLIWHPISLSGWMLRVFREEIYYGQTLLVLAAMLWVLFMPVGGKYRRLCALATGISLGWFWLTREEGAWILPGLLLMVLVAAFRILRDQRDALRYQRIRELIHALLIVVSVFTATQLIFRSVNWVVYGKFIGVDINEKNFQRALGAIHSIRSGGTKPFVSITHAAMTRASAVSPTFAIVENYFKSQGAGWGVHGCTFIKSTCGEIASGWFMWGLRGAAQINGYYTSPAKASAFFGQIADEILASCAIRELECTPQLISEMPPTSWPEVIGRFVPRYVDAVQFLILRNPPLFLNVSFGGERLLAPALRFLNYPLHTKPAEIPALDTYTFSGWYYKPRGAWFTAEVKTPTGISVDSRLERHGSPDIQQGSKDPDASDQRFLFFTRCSDDCVLQLRTPKGDTIQKTLAELRRAPVGFDFSNGHLHIDSADFQPNPEYTPSQFDRFCGGIRAASMFLYNWVFWPILALGIVFFLVSAAVYRRQAVWDVCFMMALVCWGLAFARTTLLVFIDSSTFPALAPFYLAPAYFLSVSGAVLSIAAFAQLYQLKAQSRQSHGASF